MSLALSGKDCGAVCQSIEISIPKKHPLIRLADINLEKKESLAEFFKSVVSRATFYMC